MYLLLVLYDILCMFYGGKKIGVVGWIGSGKVLLVCFYIIEKYDVMLMVMFNI